MQNGLVHDAYHTENHEVVVKLEDNRYATTQLNASNNQASPLVMFYNDAKNFWEKRLRVDIAKHRIKK